MAAPGADEKELRRSQQEEARKLLAEEKAEATESEEEDDDDEPPPDFFKKEVPGKARQSVSAEAYGAWNKKKEFEAPVVKKTAQQKVRLHSVLNKSFLFSALDSKELAIVINAMKEVITKDKDKVIEQGGDGDSLFVVEKGTMDCIIIVPDGSAKVVKTCTENDVFGELALMYNCKRAATVQSKGEAVLWQLDRDTFNHIVKDAAQKKRDRYEAFLGKVPLLSDMNAYERSQLADAIQSENFAEGSNVITAGEMGSKFYIIEEGECDVWKHDKVVLKYKAGDYFGELALIKDQPRQATVKAISPVKALSVDGASFKRLFNVGDLLSRSEAYVP